MGQMENNFLLIISILIICLIMSLFFIKSKKHNHYQCMKNTIGPNIGYCMKVAESPSLEKGIYSNAKACVEECSKPKPKTLSSGYKCFLDEEGKHQCLKVDHAPDEKVGIFSTQEECVHFCGSN